MITSIKQAKARLALYGCTLTARNGEYKVRLKGSPAGSGYFTTDLNDAVESGATMAKREEMRRAGPKAVLTATVNRCIAEGAPVVTEQRETLPDGMVAVNAQAEANEIKRPVRLYKVMATGKYYTVGDGAFVDHPPTACFLMTFNPKKD